MKLFVDHRWRNLYDREKAEPFIPTRGGRGSDSRLIRSTITPPVRNGEDVFAPQEIVPPHCHSLDSYAEVLLCCLNKTLFNLSFYGINIYSFTGFYIYTP